MSDDSDQPLDSPRSNDDGTPATRGNDLWWLQDDQARREEVREKVHADQITAIVEALGGRGVVGIYPDDDDPGHADYLYMRGFALATDADAERVHRALSDTYEQVGGERADTRATRWDGGEYWDKRGPDLPPPVKGLSVIRLPQDGPEFARTDWFQRLDDRLGPGVAMPNHVVHVTGNGGGCPANEPEPASGPRIPGANPVVASSGFGAHVCVVDSGLIGDVVDHSPWLAGVTGDEEPASMGRYRGHGTFIAGVVRAMAPEAEVEVQGAFDVGGAVDEAKLAPALERAIAGSPDVISMSAGTRSRAGKPVISLLNFYNTWLKNSETVLVAAAGNDGDHGPFYPASFPWSVGVGALDANDHLAGYSNRGSWVGVYARGSDLASSYPNGPITYYEPRADGATMSDPVTHWLATWSGTSFSTPTVAGLIAARMSRTGESAPCAWQALRAKARSRAVQGTRVRLGPGDADS